MKVTVKTFAQMAQEQAARDLAEVPNAQKYIDAARLNASDELEIDDAPPLSHAPGDGCWVAAWVWVSDSEAGIDEDDRAPFTCQGCGREESVCSADPCPDVISDREATV